MLQNFGYGLPSGIAKRGYLGLQTPLMGALDQIGTFRHTEQREQDFLCPIQCDIQAFQLFYRVVTTRCNVQDLLSL